MRVIVCGSRAAKDKPLPIETIRLIYRWAADFCYYPANEIIHGDAKGVDRTVAIASHFYQPDLKVTAVPADWDTHGKAAGPIRNLQMIMMKPDAVVAFSGGRGTANMVTAAYKNKVPVLRVTNDYYKEGSVYLWGAGIQNENRLITDET